MRDYKFRLNDLALRPARRTSRRSLSLILGLVILGGAGYGAWWWFQQEPSEAPRPVHLDANVIPLTLPPLPESNMPQAPAPAMAAPAQ